jgi:hypothetical protein
MIIFLRKKRVLAAGFFLSNRAVAALLGLQCTVVFVLCAAGVDRLQNLVAVWQMHPHPPHLSRKPKAGHETSAVTSHYSQGRSAS